MRILLSVLSIALLALGASLICDPGVTADSAVGAWRAYAAPPMSPPPSGEGVRIELVGAERLAEGAFQPLQAWPEDCEPHARLAVPPAQFASR